MTGIEDITSDGHYLISKLTGEKAVFYECDPDKNTDCDKRMCRYEMGCDDDGIGFCGKTTNPSFRKSGGRAFYAILKDGTYWGRENSDTAFWRRDITRSQTQQRPFRRDTPMYY